MNAEKKTTILACAQTTATITFITLGVLFFLIGCRQIYEFAGQNSEQAQQSATQDQTAITQAAADSAAALAQNLAEGQSLQTAATSAGVLFAWKLATILTASAGTILTGLLTKWLKTERKITSALITGIEEAEPGNVKTQVQTKATAAGVETELHARVVALT